MAWMEKGLQISPSDKMADGAFGRATNEWMVTRPAGGYYRGLTATRTPVHCSTLTIQYFSSEMPLSHKNVTAKYNNTKSRFSAVCCYRGVLLF